MAPPCREVLLTPQVRKRAGELAQQYPELIDILEPLSNGIHVEGMESLAPVLCEGMSTLLELLPKDALALV